MLAATISLVWKTCTAVCKLIAAIHAHYKQSRNVQDAGCKTLEVFSGTPVDFVCANHTYNSHKGVLPCVNDSVPSAGPDDSTYENIPRNLTHIFEFTKYSYSSSSSQQYRMDYAMHSIGVACSLTQCALPEQVPQPILWQ